MTTPRKLALATATAGLLTALLAGCTGLSGAGSPAPESEDFGAKVLGSWGSESAQQPYLEFHEDGTVTGTDGCNGIHSTYTVTDEGIDIAQSVSTLRACEGVDDWLRGVRSVIPEGDSLTAFDSAGAELGTLPRACRTASQHRAARASGGVRRAR